MDWTQIFANAVPIIGLMLPMFLWLRSEANNDRREHTADRREIMAMLVEMKVEMRDFHARLEKQDAEFKSHILYQHTERR